MTDLNKMFEPRFFAKSDVNKILQDDEQKLFVLNKKDPKNASIYKTFNEDISTFLLKLPAGPVKENVQNLVNKDLLYIALASLKVDYTFARLFLTRENKLAGVGLLASHLGIDPTSGSIDEPDLCVYASYFELCRAAVLTNSQSIKKNQDLHKLLATYLYFVFLKTIGSDKIFLQKQKDLIYLLSIYTYYMYYLKEKHATILFYIEKYYKDFIKPETIKEFMPTLEKMADYKSIKDFPRMLADVKLYNESPNTFILSLLKTLKPTAFYYFIGPLDCLIACVVTSKYPFDLLSRALLVNEKIQNAVESIIVPYINKIEYDLTAIVI